MSLPNHLFEKLYYRTNIINQINIRWWLDLFFLFFFFVICPPTNIQWHMYLVTSKNKIRNEVTKMCGIGQYSGLGKW